LRDVTTIRRLKGGRPHDGAKGASHSCLIVHHSSFGMRNDAVVLAQALRSRFADFDVFSWEVPLPSSKAADGGLMKAVPDGLKPLLPFDFVVFLEHVRPIARIWDPGFARRVAFIPNIEWLTPFDEAAIRDNRLDAVLYKNAFSARLASSLPTLADVPLSRVLGWTAEDLLEGVPQTGMNYDVAMHLQGLSRQKQTERLLRAWLARPHFPRLLSLSSSTDGLRLPAPADMAPNIRVFIGEIGNDRLRRMQRECGIHVYPSAAEGFGLALDEARSAGAVLVTTGAPPMSDFVEDGVSGILIPVREGSASAFGRSVAFKVEEDDIGAAMERVLALSIDERRAMGMRARAAYVRQRERFHAAVGDFVSDFVGERV
jgi:glycosyltransferase involved in cell wall biosynthesis